MPSSPTVYSRPTPQRVRRGASEGWPGAREAAPNRGAGLTAVLLSSAQIPFRTAFPTVTEVHPLGSGRGSEEMRCRKVAARARPVPSRPVPSQEKSRCPCSRYQTAAGRTQAAGRGVASTQPAPRPLSPAPPATPSPCPRRWPGCRGPTGLLQVAGAGAGPGAALGLIPACRARGSGTPFVAGGLPRAWVRRAGLHSA